MVDTRDLKSLARKGVWVQVPPRVQQEESNLKYYKAKSTEYTILVARSKKDVLVAQLVEQLTLNQWVQGSSPCQDTTSRGVAQLASAPRSGRGGRTLELSHPDKLSPEKKRNAFQTILHQCRNATLAKLVEQRIRNA